MAVKRICEAIMRDEKPILTVSSYQDGPYGLHDVVLSMPCVVGRGGVDYQVPHPLDEHETTRLHESARTLREIIDQLEL